MYLDTYLHSINGKKIIKCTYTAQFISLPLLPNFQPDFTASLCNLIAKETCCDILAIAYCNTIC